MWFSVELIDRLFVYFQTIRPSPSSLLTIQYRLTSVARGTFDKLPSLKVLDLSGNEFFGIPSGISPSLEYLFLENNESVHV